MSAIFLGAALLTALALSVAIVAQQNKNKPTNSSSARDVFDSLSDWFKPKPTTGTLCCGQESNTNHKNWRDAFSDEEQANAAKNNAYNNESSEGEGDENEPPKNKKARTAEPGEKVRTPDSHPEDFKRGERGKRVNKHTGDIWDKSHTTHNDPEGEWKVGTKKGQSPRKTNKVTIGKDGTVIKIDK